MARVRYADLFCGLGAFHTAFSDFECVFACDIDEGIRTIYKANYGSEVHGDIRTVNCETFPDIDLLCAGFPCQPFSIAGKGEGFEDTVKGTLFYDILTILDAKRPKMCLLENVKQLTTHDGGRTYATIERALQDRGYTVVSKVLTASQYGSPQHRQRIFLVATLGPPFRIPDGDGQTVPVSAILEDGVAGDVSLGKYHLVAKRGAPPPLSKPRCLYDVLDKVTQKGGRQGERVYSIDHVGITVCASSGGPGAKTGLYKVGETIRRLTVRETLRMFGFPEDYTFCDASREQALFYLGNSIVVDVLRAFVPSIREWFATEDA